MSQATDTHNTPRLLNIRDLLEVEDMLDDVRILLDAIQMGAETLGRREANALTKLAGVTSHRLIEAIEMMVEMRKDAA